MKEKIQKIYEQANAYISELDTVRPIDIIENTSELYIEYKNKLPQELQEICSKCCKFINKDYDNYITFSQIILVGTSLIENIYDIFGKWLNNN